MGLQRVDCDDVHAGQWPFWGLDECRRRQGATCSDLCAGAKVQWPIVQHRDGAVTNHSISHPPR